MKTVKKFNEYNSDKSIDKSVDEKNYMFWGNLKVIKDAVDNMLSMDKEQINSILESGDWAIDHIASSKDDIEEVSNFLKNIEK